MKRASSEEGTFRPLRASSSMMAGATSRTSSTSRLQGSHSSKSRPRPDISAWMKAALRTRCGQASRTPLPSLAVSLASLPEPVALQHHQHSQNDAEGLTQSHSQSHTLASQAPCPPYPGYRLHFSCYVASLEGLTDRQEQFTKPA